MLPQSKIVHTYCGNPFIQVKISTNGEITMCCHQHLDWNLGNILQHPFEDLWFSQEAETIRQNCREEKFSRCCITSECPCCYKREITAWEANANGYPLYLELDLHGSHCNFGGQLPTPQTSCIMCPRSRPDFQRHLQQTPDKTKEIVNKIKHIVPHLEFINILGIAEPFWKDKIFEVMDDLNFEQFSKQLCLWTTTNGSVFNPQQQLKLGKLISRSKIAFSLDAATPQTYQKIRRYDFFEKVCTNIVHWCQLREAFKRTNTGHHLVLIHNNINTLNVHEVPEMVRLAKKMGVDILVLLPTHNCGGTHPEIEPFLPNQQNYPIFAEAEKKAKELAQQLEQKIEITRPLALNYVPST